MTSTRSSFVESVASRVRRSPRAAAVDARRRLSAMAEDAFEQQTAYVRPVATSTQARPSVVNHRYMLRSMRRSTQ